mmetsp:Transcript_143442/g.357432  ORF Transcript_143442/g.357432 Transcript_143442/m.357432 type:complete len:88 (+) Transcript_143442:784-1047(+)
MVAFAKQVTGLDKSSLEKSRNDEPCALDKFSASKAPAVVANQGRYPTTKAVPASATPVTKDTGGGSSTKHANEPAAERAPVSISGLM